MPTQKQISQIQKDEHDDVSLAKRVTLVSGDIQLGAVEIKDSLTTSRVSVSTTGQLQTDLAGLRVPLQSTVTVGTTAIAVPASALTGRKNLTMWNSNASLTVYYGASGLASGAGIQLDPEEKVSLDAESGILAIAEANYILLRILELA